MTIADPLRTALAFNWDFGGGVTTQGRSASISPTQYGCYGVAIQYERFDGSVASECRKIWTSHPWGNDGCGFVTGRNDIITINVTDRQVVRQTGFHFSPLSAPLAPIPGGFYVAYSRTSLNDTEVREFDNSFNLIRTITLPNAKGRPMGLTATGDGFAVLIRGEPDTNFLFLLVMNQDGTEKWRKTIMNNGVERYNRNPDQLLFPDGSGSTAAKYGLNLTYNPSSGRIAYGRGRIAVAFAHYNVFGINATGTIDAHTGDTVVSFSLVNTSDIQCVWSWGTSHSLVSRVIYDGEMFSFAALGDAYPQNIRFATFETGAEKPGLAPWIDLTSKSSSTVVAGNITGNLGGSSCGRMGDVTLLSTNPVRYGLAYSRWPYTATSGTSYSPNTVDELAFVTYNQNLVRPDYSCFLL